MAKSRIKKVFSFVMIGIGGLIIGLSITAFFVLRLSLPPTDGKILYEGLQSEVEVTFDKMGIPQIWAENETDAYFVLGFQHAADRLFQMDLTRRLAQGRLSEMFGEATFDIDLEQRMIGHNLIGEKAVDKLSGENRKRLEAYINGINFYIDNCRALPFEYRVLPVDCEQWNPADCLTMLSFQSWYSNALMNREEFYQRLTDEAGEEKARTLDIPYPDWAPSVIKETKQSSPDKIRKKNYGLKHPSVDYDYDLSLSQRTILERYFDDGNYPFLLTEASNAWVVSPDKSESGFAMLASDPHLEISRLPQFWYAVGIHVKDSFDAIGITTPGLPFVVMGHNREAAWAFTAGGNDVTDYTALPLNPENKNQYLDGSEYIDFEHHIDSISTLGGEKIEAVFRISPYGPIVENLSNDSSAIAFYWNGYSVDIDQALSSGFSLVKVKTFEQFQKAVTRFGALDANMMYADINGNIGYQLTTPIRDKGKTVESSSDKYSIKTSDNFLFENNPHSLNPSEGWIASCNNISEKSGVVNGHFFIDRILRIEELLSLKEKYNSDDMTKYQLDLTDRYHQKFKDEISEVLTKIGLEDKARSIRQWDGSCDSSSLQTGLIICYLNKLKEYTFKDELPELYTSIPDRWIEIAHDDAFQFWYDDIYTKATVETYEDISAKAMREALALVGDKTWGELLTLKMEHPMAIIPILNDVLTLGTKEESHEGTTGTLNAAFPRMASDGSFSAKAGPSWRFVADFSDIDQATMVLPAGNSGNPMSDHFLDFYELWKSGKRWTVPSSYEKVKKQSVSQLIFTPGN